MIAYRIVMPHFVCGIVVNNEGEIIEAAPIMRWSTGKKLDDIRDWILRKKGTIEVLK